MTRPRRERCRVGLIGFGFIGRQVYERIRDEPAHGLEVGFVHNRDSSRLKGVPRDSILDDLAAFAERDVDLIVEMAHPDITERWAQAFLGASSYLPLSVTALADDALRERLIATAAERGHVLAVPHGALMGLDTLREWRHQWESVEITFEKAPGNIDFSNAGIDPTSIAGATLLYDGPVRGIAKLYPRNVNTMVTCALATVGLDRCRARLRAVPGLNVAIAEVRAQGRDGSLLSMRKEQPVSGVSGTEMFESQFASIVRAARLAEPFGFV